jgi:DNA-binding XRE family transcriptional regulator
MTSLSAVLRQELKDPRDRELFAEYGRLLEVAYRIAELRRLRRMSQEELARRIGSTQSNIARIENGRQNLSLNLLGKIAQALDSKLQISLL